MASEAQPPRRTKSIGCIVAESRTGMLSLSRASALDPLSRRRLTAGVSARRIASNSGSAAWRERIHADCMGGIHAPNLAEREGEGEGERDTRRKPRYSVSAETRLAFPL